MTKSIKMLALALAAVFAFAAASSASVSAHVFLSSLEKGTLKDTGGEQVFETVVGSKVICKKETSSGTASGFEAPTNTEDVLYTECTAFGSPAEVSLAEYQFSAEGWVSVLNTITIKVPALGCSVTVGPQKELKTVTYTNLAGGKIEVNAKVEKITWSGTGGLCGTGGTAGKYTGKSVVEEVSGTISWQ